jgi:hypothetical protein
MGGQPPGGTSEVWSAGGLRHGLQVFQQVGIVMARRGSCASALMPPRPASSGVAPVLRRGRLLLLQGVASMFTDQLGEALLARAETDPLHGDALRAAMEEIRVGAVADADGQIEHRSRA